MSYNLVQSLERVTSTINRQIRYGADEDNNESFRSTRTPIQKFAERLEPAARSEIIKSLSREALYEQPWTGLSNSKSDKSTWTCSCC